MARAGRSFPIKAHIQRASLVSSAYILAGDTGVFLLTGNAATVTVAHLLSSATGSFTLTGNAVTMRRGYELGSATGAFVLTGNAATLGHGYRLNGAAGAFTLTGKAATLTRSANILSAGTGTFILTGGSATLTSSSQPTPTPEASAGGGQALSAWFVEEFGGRITGMVEDEPKPKAKAKPVKQLQPPAVYARYSLHASPGGFALRGGEAQLQRGVTPEKDADDLQELVRLAMQALREERDSEFSYEVELELLDR